MIDNIDEHDEAKRSKLELDYHRKKLRKLNKEFTNAEIWEKQLIKKNKEAKEKSKPILLKFIEALEPPVFAPRALVEDAISKEPWQKVK